MYCDECGKRLKDGVDFCYRCIAKNDDVIRDCAVCENPIEEDFHVYLTPNPETAVCSLCDKTINTLITPEEDEQDKNVAYSYLNSFFNDLKNKETKKYLNEKLKEYEQEEHKFPDIPDVKTPKIRRRIILTHKVKSKFIFTFLILFYYFVLGCFFVGFKLIHIEENYMSEESYYMYGYRQYETLEQANTATLEASGTAVFILYIHITSILFFFSRIYQNISLLAHGARKIIMQEEREFLIPLFDEVYEEVIKENPKTNKNIRPYIIDSLNVESFAVGNAIVISKGIVDSFTEEEIKSVLAHEFAHISNHYTTILLFIQASLIFLTLMINLYKFLTTPKKIIIKQKKDADYSTAAVQSNHFIFDFLFFIPTFFFQALFAVGKRSNEFYADEFASKLGYGEALKSVLKAIYEIELTRKLSFMERLMNAHPPTPERISRLEQFN